jgi:CHAT domain-containing protein
MVSEHRKYNQESRGVEWVADNSFTRSGWSFLPNTEREVSEVSSILSNSRISVTGYSGTSGTEESFKALNGKHPGHIHIATHGFYLKFAPADSAAIASSPEKRISSSLMALTRSGLILSNGGRAWKGDPIPEGIDDGILQADEIAGLDLSGTSLLVLSACQTALGDISSDGVYGLQRAFKNAGVETIIMSLWEVDDKATFEFMAAFYRSLTKGRSKHDAFCNAQRQLKKNYDDPYYWAAFIMLD